MQSNFTCYTLYITVSFKLYASQCVPTKNQLLLNPRAAILKLWYAPTVGFVLRIMNILHYY
ncbi:hypothetical protein C0J52_15839 [Blattella germanica]|nr:hypothetical protein C0J52_15839 [Blattella germanica]